jgi:hypothetical protein
VDVDAVSGADHVLEAVPPLPVVEAVLDVRADVRLGGRIEPLAPGAAERIDAPSSLDLIEHRERLQQQHHALGVRADVVRDLLRGCRAAREPLEDAHAHTGDRDPGHRHAEHGMAVRHRPEVHAHRDLLQHVVRQQPGPDH